MYLFLFLISVALIYIFWCLKTQRDKKKETREGFASGKQASTIQQSGGRKLTRHITRGEDDEEVFDLTYSPLWIERKQESISNLIVDNSNLGASNLVLVQELIAIASDIQYMSGSNSYLNDQIYEVNGFINELKEYIINNYYDYGTHSNYIGQSSNDYFNLSNVERSKEEIENAFKTKAKDIQDMLRKGKLMDGGTSYATKGEIDSLISKFGRVKDIFIQFTESLKSISNIDVTSPSNADIEDLYTQMRNNCESRTSNCFYQIGSGSNAELTPSNYGYSFDPGAWPDSNCIAQNEGCYDDPTTFTCSSNVDTCYYYQGNEFGGTMTSSNFPMEVSSNESNYSCITSTSISDPCRTSNQVQAQIDCLANNYACYAISNDENSNQWTYSTGSMNQVYDVSTEECTQSNQCTYSLQTARAAVSNYCDSNDDDVCYAFNSDYSLTQIPPSNVLDASGDIVNFPEGQLAVYESSVDGGECWRRACEMDATQHTDRSVLCSSNTDECFYYTASGSTGSGTITSSNEPLSLSNDSNSCYSPCLFESALDACIAQSNLCWTSSNGDLSSTWSTNELSSDGSNCSNVCDHNSQEEACSNDMKTCHTYSNTDEYSGIITNSNYHRGYTSNNSNCDDPCDSTIGLYDTPSDACATKSNLCWTSSNGDLLSSWSTNVLSSDGSNCSNVCDHNSQREACSNDEKRCYTYSNNGPGSRSGTISNSDHRFTYDSGNSCVDPCDSSRGLYGSQSDACATKSNICYTLSGTTVSSTYEVNTLSNDNSNCVDSCTGYQTGQQVCDTLSNLCYSLNDNGQLESNYRTYTYSNGQCVAPTPCSNDEDFDVCQFPDINSITSWTSNPSDPASWSNLGSNCQENNADPNIAQTGYLKLTVNVGRSNDGNCRMDNSRSNYERWTTNLVDHPTEKCPVTQSDSSFVEITGFSETVTSNSYSHEFIFNVDIDGIRSFMTSVNIADNTEIMLITNIYRMGNGNSQYILVHSDNLQNNDNIQEIYTGVASNIRQDKTEFSLHSYNIANGDKIKMKLFVEIIRLETVYTFADSPEYTVSEACSSETMGTCWSLSNGNTLTLQPVSKTWNGISCETSCTYDTASDACASLTNTCYSVTNYETITTSFSGMEPDTNSTQCKPQNTCTYTGSFTISIDSVVARVNGDFINFSGSSTNSIAQFYIVKTTTMTQVKLYEATTNKYLHIFNNITKLSETSTSSIFSIYRSGEAINNTYFIKSNDDKFWSTSWTVAPKKGRFSSSESDKVIITTSIPIPDQFLSEYNVDCEFDSAGLSESFTDNCYSESCVRTKQIRLKQKPSGDGLTCSNFITRTYGTGFTYDGSFDELNSNDVIEITSDCQTRIRCCTSNDINYKFEVFGSFGNTIDASELLRWATSITVSESNYDGYDDSYIFTIALATATGYSSGFSYTFTKAQWETNQLPYLDTTFMTGYIPTQIRLTKTYNTDCAPSTNDPSLDEPIFKNISHTSPLRLCDSSTTGHYTTQAQYLYMNGNTVSDSSEYDTCASSITRHRQWDTEACRPLDDALSNNGQYYDSNGLECFEVDADFINGLLRSGSTKYALGYSNTIDTRTKVKIGGTSSVVLDTQFSHSYVWKVFKNTGSSFGTPIAQWTDQSLGFRGFNVNGNTLSRASNVDLNTFIDTVDDEDSKHNKTYKIEVSVTRTSDGYIPDTKSVEFEYFQYQMDVRRVVNNVSYNNNTNQLTINLKTGTNYQSGHWGEAKTQILLYSSSSTSPQRSKFLITNSSNAIIFNNLLLSQTELYHLELYHEETDISSSREQYDIQPCASNYVQGNYLYRNGESAATFDAYSNCLSPLSPITRYSEFQSNCVLPPNVITENDKNYDRNSGVQCEPSYTLGPIDDIEVSYNAITQRLSILYGSSFVNGTNGPPGAKLMIQISADDVTETFINFPSSSTLSAATQTRRVTHAGVTTMAMAPAALATQTAGQMELELSPTHVGTGINRYHITDLDSLVFENVQLRRTQQVRLFMVNSSNNIVSGVDSHDITDKLRVASFGGQSSFYRPSVINISQNNRRITLQVTKTQRDIWVIYDDTTIEIKLWNDNKYLNLTKTSETSNTGITLGTSDMKMSFSNSTSSNDYELVLDVTDNYNLDYPATLHFTFYNGETAIEGPYTEVGLPTCGYIRKTGISCVLDYSSYSDPPCARDPYTSTWYKAEASSGSKYVVDRCFGLTYEDRDKYYRRQVDFKKDANANCYGPETGTEFSESRNHQLLINHGCPR